LNPLERACALADMLTGFQTDFEREVAQELTAEERASSGVLARIRRQLAIGRELRTELLALAEKIDREGKL
jgi:hypothetical protein